MGMGIGLLELKEREWARWLAEQDYGIDYHTGDLYPPCSLLLLAQEYEKLYRDHPLGNGMSVGDWVECIEAESGEWPADKRD